MARMPAGTMRFATNAGQEFTQDITDPAKKSKVMDVIIPADSDTDKAYRNAIAKVLGIADTSALTKISRDVFKSLVIQGEATIDGKKVTMTGQSIMLCAYGDCTNPGVAMKIGKISTPNIPGKQQVDISAMAETTLM